MFLTKFKFSVLIKYGSCITGEKFPQTGTGLRLSAKQQKRHRYDTEFIANLCEV